MIHFTNPAIIREIEDKLVQIKKNKGEALTDLSIKKADEAAIEYEAIRHSCRIETDSETHAYAPRAHLFSTPHSRKTKKMFKALQAATAWGANVELKNGITEEFVKTISGLIDPVFHQALVASYRNKGVRPSSATWTPPEPEKVLTEMPKFITELNQICSGTGTANSVEAAIYAHLHLIRIHPFEDTNGRTARTIQNIILMKKRLPLPVIFTGERHDYYKHLDDAVNSYRERKGFDYKAHFDSKGEREFYNFMAGKISSSLDRIMGA